MTGCVIASLDYLDHVQMILIRKDSIDFTVQLLEGVLNGVGPQRVIALVFANEVVACKAKESVGRAATSIQTAHRVQEAHL